MLMIQKRMLIKIILKKKDNIKAEINIRLLILMK